MRLKDIFTEDYVVFSDKNMGRFLFHPDYRMERHAHRRLEVMLLISGSLEITFYGGEGAQPDATEAVVIKKGQIILIDENVEHCIRVLQERTEFLNLEFTLQPVPRTSETAFDMKCYLGRMEFFKRFVHRLQRHMVADDTVNLKDSILRIHDTIFESEINREISYLNDLLLASFLIDLARCQIPEKYTTDNFHVNKAIRLITLNISNDITVDFLAEKINVNKSYLQRLFKEQTGKTIISFLNELRINQAKKLLSNKNFDIIDVAVEVGFNNRQNFAVAFKKYTGLNPSEFRRAALKKEYTTY